MRANSGERNSDSLMEEWILSGSLKYVFDGGESVITDGEVLVAQPVISHSVVAPEDMVKANVLWPAEEDWTRGGPTFPQAENATTMLPIKVHLGT